MNLLIQLKKAAPVFLVALGWFELLPTMQGVSPPPDGCYPAFTTAEGCNALAHLGAGAGNTGVGWYSLFSVGEANYNTGLGAGTLILNTADSNTAVGTAALLLNTSGDENVAVGTDALVYNDSGADNVAVGAFALYNNDASFNTAVGADALADNFISTDNTAIGDAALSFNDVAGTGVANGNTAVGSVALTFNTDGDRNTAVGALALFDNTTGPANTATGYQALNNNLTGNGNTGIGVEALFGNSAGNTNTALGYFALHSATGTGSIGIGSQAGAFVGSSNNVIAIGSPGDDVPNSCFIGNIRGVTTQNADAMPVLIDSAGQLGTANSSRRYKTDIQRIDKASESILGLKPVSFRYKVHKNSSPQVGLIAEEVAQVNPDLVIYDTDGKPYSVRYDAVNAMLLNEFLKEHQKVQKLEATVTKQQKAFEATVTHQQKQIEALSAGLQKVSAQLAAASPSDTVLGATKQVASNNQ